MDKRGYHTHTHTHVILMTAKAASSRNYFRQLLAGTHTGRYVDEQSLKATYVGSACCPNLDGKEFHHPFILISCLGLHAIPRMHTCTHVNCKASKLFGFLAFWHQLFWLWELVRMCLIEGSYHFLHICCTRCCGILSKCLVYLCLCMIMYTTNVHTHA